MDIIENWNLLNDRMNAENAEWRTELFQIHMGAFDDLRKNGHLLKINDKPISEYAPTISPQQRLELAGKVGRSLIDAQGDLFHKTFSIKLADAFPNCIFIAVAAIIENLEGGFNTVYPDQKLAVVCKYEIVVENGDPLGHNLSILEKCYPWVSLSVETNAVEPQDDDSPRYIPQTETKLVFKADNLSKIDTMRTAFSGVVQRGSIRKGDVLNVVEGTGRVLCNEGCVLSMFTGGQKIEMAAEGQRVDEICLAVEVPFGSYRGLFLVDGDKTLAASAAPQRTDEKKEMPDPEESAAGTKSPEKKKGFWSNLFGR